MKGKNNNMTKPEYFESERRKELPHLEATVMRYDMLFIDTSSVMSPHFVRFATNIIPFLKKHNKKMIVCESVLRELKRLKQISGDSEMLVREVYSYMGLYVLDRFIEHGVLDYVNDGIPEGPADLAFQNLFISLRPKKRLLLITQDQNLTNSILRFNLDKSVYAEPIGVKQINQMGVLEPRSKLSLPDSQEIATQMPQRSVKPRTPQAVPQQNRIPRPQPRPKPQPQPQQTQQPQQIEQFQPQPEFQSTPSGAFTARDAKTLSGTQLHIPVGYTSVGFIDRSDITMAFLPDTITTIAEQAFRDCMKLTHIAIPDSVTAIEASAFSNCRSLQSIRIPSGVRIINNGTFKYCFNLKDVFLPEGLTSIGSIAFKGCASLKRITIPSSVMFIGRNAFSSCPGLVIRCAPGSCAHAYAVSNGIQHEEI